ncbi:MAG: M50 family metallopeptidase [Myxococcota bacterium]|nr:M50 family metallopeptidase [Myxococcota bacterium]
MAPEEDGGPTRFALVIACVGIALVSTLVPFGDVVLYPFTLFGTWVHEMGHGLTAIALGGQLDSIDVFWNASGLAHCRGYAPGWPRGLVSLGGLLAPPLLGAFILAFARGPRRATIVLWALVAVMGVSVALWVRSVAGLVAVPGVAFLIGLLAKEGSPTLKHVGAQGLGVLLALDTIFGVDYLFTASAHVDGEARASDVANLAEAVGGHWLLWGVAIAVVSFALLALGLKLAWLAPLRLGRRKEAFPEDSASA